MDARETYWAFAAGLVSLLGFVVYKDAVVAFFMLAALMFVYVSRRRSDRRKEDAASKTAAFWKDIEQTMMKRPFIMLGNDDYDVHRRPRSLYILQKTPTLRDVMYGMRYVLVYNQSLYVDIASLVELFLERHFDAMNGRGDPKTHWSSLNQTRLAVLDALQRAAFDTPSVPRADLLPSGKRSFDQALKNAVETVRRQTYVMMEALYRNHVKKGVKGLDRLHVAPFPWNIYPLP